MDNKKYVYSFATLAALAALTTAAPALADTTTPGTQPNTSVSRPGEGGGRAMMKSGVFGTVSAISGNMITVSGNQGFWRSSATTNVVVQYTVDATNAKIMKNNVAGTISSIVVGDTIMVQGAVTGTNVVATTIRDGQIGKGMHGGPKTTPDATKITPPITGNGQPVVAGTVSAVSGSTLTITNKSNVTYTIDATSAKIVQGQNTISISNVVVGDTIIAQGTVNGNSVVASSVIDQKAPVAGTTEPQSKGFFGSIGSFFSRLFGF